jgi:hypothetical protein
MLRGYCASCMSKDFFFPKLRWSTAFQNHLLHYKHAVFYASNNKSNGVAKTIDNRFHVVKDRIQDQILMLSI